MPNTEPEKLREEKDYSSKEFVKLYMNDHNGGTPRWLRGAFFDERERIDTILEYMRGIESKLTASNLASREEVKRKYQDALIWCSGSDDFQIGGKAREGWEKICLPLLKP